MSTERILVVGGYGVFGGRLAIGLLHDLDAVVLVAGRSAARAESFCRQHGGKPVVLDRQAPDLAERIAALAPAIVVDAAGPFQAYAAAPYALAEAALAAGAHYLDLSDDAAFVAGVSRLDPLARQRGLVALSGASSVPALSSAAAGALTTGLDDIHLIESTILPGNRAPRGLSVIQAILAQAGRPMRLWRGGAWIRRPGWSGLRRETIRGTGGAAGRNRLSSLIGAPDLLLFPQRYRARSVMFRAGLDLWVMHLGLWALSALVRVGVIRSLVPAATVLKRVADRLERFGSDRGAMIVRVKGVDCEKGPVERTWTLIAEAGDGPFIPTLAARVLCARLLRNDVPVGARPCLEEVTLKETEAAAAELKVSFHRAEVPATPLFASALGGVFHTLPAEVRDLHCVLDQRRWAGTSRVDRGTSWLARAVCAAVGFPASGANVPVTVEMTRTRTGEVWVRSFAGRRFRSVLRPAGRPGSGLVTERFGPFGFTLRLTGNAGRLHYPLLRGTFLGVPLPAMLLPRSETAEYVEAGKAAFDVGISLPFIGLIVRYRGILAEPPKTFNEEEETG